jgi:hypothetical protein
MRTAVTLTEEVAGVLAAAELRQAAVTPTGHPASTGFTVEQFPGYGLPARVAVTWHDNPGSQTAIFGLNRCWNVLSRAGYQTYLAGGRGHRDYLTVLQQPRRIQEKRTCSEPLPPARIRSRRLHTQRVHPEPGPAHVRIARLHSRSRLPGPRLFRGQGGSAAAKGTRPLNGCPTAVPYPPAGGS